MVQVRMQIQIYIMHGDEVAMVVMSNVNLVVVLSASIPLSIQDISSSIFSYATVLKQYNYYAGCIMVSVSRCLYPSIQIILSVS